MRSVEFPVMIDLSMTYTSIGPNVLVEHLRKNIRSSCVLSFDLEAGESQRRI